MVGKARWWGSSLATVSCERWGGKVYPDAARLRRTAGDDDKDGHNTGDPDWQFHSQLHSINIMNILLDDLQSTHRRFAASLCPNSVARSPARSLARLRCWSFDRYIITNCGWRASSFALRGGRDRALGPIARMPLLLQLLHACSPKPIDNTNSNLRVMPAWGTTTATVRSNTSFKILHQTTMYFI